MDGMTAQYQKKLCELLRRIEQTQAEAICRAADLLQTYVLQLRFNLNVGHAAGALGVALWDVIR